MSHSKIVGGSTAKRVIACPGSVALVDKMPPRPGSSYADEGTLLHDAISQILNCDADVQALIGSELNGTVLTPELAEEKLAPALAAMDILDPACQMTYVVEATVDFGDRLPGVFGSVDLIGRVGNRAVVLDWKFGSGVPVDAEENHQLLFYAAAAIRTPATKWVFEGADDIELIIVQPPSVKRWVTTFDRVAAFERELAGSVRAAAKPNAPLVAGEHCRWCAAKPICPVMTGAADRALQQQLDTLPVDQISHYLSQAALLEGWLSDLRQLAHQMLEEGKVIPAWKLVPKRAARRWRDDAEAVTFLTAAGVNAYTDPALLSPAQAEKALKKAKTELPANLTVAVSSGTTLAPADDPRPEVAQIGRVLSKAMLKFQ